MTNTVIIPAGADFQTAQVPARKPFKKAYAVIRQAIEAVNPDSVGKLAWEDFSAIIDATGKTVTLSLVDQPRNRYVLDESLVFNYNDIQLIDVLTQGLGFAAVYEETQKDEVIAALDSELFETSYDSQTQILTVTVKPAANTVNFTSDNATPATALLVGKTAQISFVDIVNVAEVLVNRDLTFAVTDLVEAG